LYGHISCVRTPEFMSFVNKLYIHHKRAHRQTDRQTDREAVLHNSKENGLNVNTEKLYMFMSSYQNAGQNHNIEKGNRVFEKNHIFGHCSNR
jgi:hypothetical protein